MYRIPGSFSPQHRWPIVAILGATMLAFPPIAPHGGVRAGRRRAAGCGRKVLQELAIKIDQESRFPSEQRLFLASMQSRTLVKLCRKININVWVLFP